MLATQRPAAKTLPTRLRVVLGSRFTLRVMDYRDSNIILGEQMNPHGYDSSRLPSRKGVGVLRPDGETQAGAEVLALTVRTFYMPNEDWREICQRGRALREGRRNAHRTRGRTGSTTDARPRGRSEGRWQRSDAR
ncbi:hypothetical protein AB0A63_05715 [Lentzea sp. NPDC042327]|uniref:hypothetical protein n=1 Tax=Lentzea sp. NPDC042327 TaxID=3154801 RepID=UPI0034050CB2